MAWWAALHACQVFLLDNLKSTMYYNTKLNFFSWFSPRTVCLNKRFSVYSVKNKNTLKKLRVFFYLKKKLNILKITLDCFAFAKYNKHIKTKHFNTGAKND